MAETITIEIPINAIDNTAGGISSAQRRMNGLDKAVEKMQKKLEKICKDHFKIDLDANETASDKLANVDAALQRVNGEEARVSVNASSDAEGVLHDVSDAVSKLDGEEAVVGTEADGNAEGVLNDVGDKVAELDGSTATVETDADDTAEPVMDDVMDKLAKLDGAFGTIEIDADDAASAPIDDVSAKINELDGKTATVSLQADDMVSDKLDGAAAFTQAQAGALAGAMGASFGVYDSINTFADFEAGMSQVKAISGATGEDFDALTAKAKQMGATTKFTATQSAEAFNYMAMAGWKAGDMISGIDGIMNLAAASGESLGTTSDIVTDALTAFGLKASDSTHFADVLAQASANANTNVGMMGESFKYVAPIAGALGYSIEDTSLALGLMANSGIKSSMAGTALRRTITALANPTDKQAAAMEKYGISLTKDTGEIKSLSEVMTDLRSNLRGLDKDEQTAAVSQMFGAQAMSGMLAIINSTTEDYEKLSDAVNNADGASKDMADTMLDNMQGSFTLMQSAIEGVEDALGEGLSPYLRTLADTVTGAMPEATKAIDDFFTDFDSKVQAMTSSKEWTEADFFGKVNIAWDKLIVDPFRSWADSSGASTIADVIGGLFSNALNVLPGGDEAQLTDWLSVGVLALAGEKIAGLASKVYNLGSAIGSFSWGSLSTGGMIAAGIGAAATAIWAINTAIDAYNQKEIKTDLEAHFGQIELTEEQKQAIASEVLDFKWKANIDLALGEIRNADTLRSTAEQRLNENEAIEYKAKVGVRLSKDDSDAYSSNIDEFIKARKDELEGRTFSAKLMVDTTLATPEGKTLSSAIDSWTLQDNIEMSSLSSQLSTAVSDALADGILSADETQAISALQEKINSIVDKWKIAEQQAARDMLVDKYGNLSGEELSSGAYEGLVQEMQEQREAGNSELDNEKEALRTILHALDNEGRLAEVGLTYDQMDKQLSQAIQYEKDRGSANDLGFQTNTLNQAYSEEGESWNAGITERNTDAISSLLAFGNTAGAAGMLVNSNANSGLNTLFDTYMASQVEDMYSTLQGYMSEFGGKVPEELRSAYMDAINTGAFAGSSSGIVAFQSLANAIAESGDQALIEAVQNGNYGEDMMNALEIALAEGTDEVATVDGLQAEVSKLNVTQESAENVRKSVQDFMDSTSEAGAEVEYDAGNVIVKLGEGADTSGIQNALNMTEEELSGHQIEIEGGGVEYKIPEDQILSAQERAAQEIAGESGGEFKIDGGEAYIEYTINEGDTLTAIEEATGVAKEEIAEMNGIDDMNEIEAGVTIKIPADQVNVDAEGDIEQKVQEELKGESAEPMTVEPTVNTEAQPGENNFDETRAQTEETADEAFADPYEESGMPVNVTAAPGTDNFSQVYEQFKARAQAEFARPIPVSATVSVNSGGGGSAGGGADHSATGRYVNGPMLSWIGEDGPEYVIPVGADKHGRGMDLWMQAGRDLGVPGFANGGFIGEESMIVNPFERKKGSGFDLGGLQVGSSSSPSPIGPESVLGAAGGSVQPIGGTSNSASVNVNLSPVIQINGSGMNEDEIFNVMKNRIKEVADDIGYEVGEKLTKIFDNMPLA